MTTRAELQALLARAFDDTETPWWRKLAPQELAARVLAVLDSAGLRLAPNDPTEAMCDAGAPHMLAVEFCRADPAEVYRAMLAARPDASERGKS